MFTNVNFVSCDISYPINTFVDSWRNMTSFDMALFYDNYNQQTYKSPQAPVDMKSVLTC